MELLIIILIIIGVVTCKCYFNSAKYKGRVGEKIVTNILSKLPNEYFQFDDVYLELNGRSVQIDHVVISKYGVFVIETKNYKGWIYGSETATYWTKNMFGEKFMFYNPLKQNFFHSKSLQTLLNLPDYIVKSFVVFLDKAELKVYHENLIYASELKNKILSYKAIVLSDEQVNQCVQILSTQNIVDSTYRKEHVANIYNEMYLKEHLAKSGICPRCRGFLVERRGRNGMFLGCSNYPKCRFVKNL